MIMKYIYHYHATIQDAPGATTNIDGIIESSQTINSMDRYSEIKSVIANNDGFDASKLVICSLSLLETIAE